tara:strand:+ start:563 stop:925 length:363 start_codon:yes stop_codon:yes gene_type:complete
LTKNFIAGAAVSPRRIVKFGADDDHVIHGAAVGDALFGITTDLGAATDERIDVHVAGLPEVEYGGTIAAGALLTSDANGKAVAAAPATGVNNRIIGTAMVAGVDGDIGTVLLAPGQIQGA